MTVLLLMLLALASGPPQKPAAEKAPQKGAKKPEIVVLDPTAPKLEEDPNAPPVEYAHNPHQAKKEFAVGDFYWRKRSYAAAAVRFQEAVKWDQKFALAYLKLGQAREKTGELQQALEAYQKYLELDPKGKNTRDARKAIARLERELK